MKLILAIVLLSPATLVSAGFLKAHNNVTVSNPNHNYAQDCGMQSYLRVLPGPVSMLQEDNVPGAGIDNLYNAQLNGVLEVKYSYDPKLKDAPGYKPEASNVRVVISSETKTYDKNLARISRTVVLEKDLSLGVTVEELKSLIRKTLPVWKDRQDITLLFEDGTTAKGQDRLIAHTGVTIMWESNFAPFKRVWKDGYSLVNCVKDTMFYHGDKYGDHKDEYTKGSSRVSIVHYDGFIALSDRVRMSPKVCFDFCRTVPNMVYFGITTAAKVNQCYCMPYFEAMAGDSSQCDSPCEADGEPGCGGESKSSIYSMRSCDNTLTELGKSERNARDLRDALDHTILELTNYIALIDGAAADMIPLFGHVGDSVATGLAQWARKYGMFATNTLARGRELADKLDFLYQELGNHGQVLATDLQSSKMVKRAESLVEETQEVATKGEETLDKLDGMIKTIHPEITFRSEFKAIDAYRPVMYFVDNKLDGVNNPGRDVQKLGDEIPVPTTCNGEIIGAPIIDMNREDCAQACDQQLVNGCKAFQHFDNEGYGSGQTRRQLCFLFSSVSGHAGHYYTGCKESERGTETNLRTGCWTKFSKFAGGKFDGSGTLKPDPRAHSHPLFCKECFKTFTRYDRCYTALTDKKEPE